MRIRKPGLIEIPLLWGLFGAFCAPARADLLMDLEAGRFEGVQRLEQEARSPNEKKFYAALDAFYSGDLKEAQILLADVPEAALGEHAWVKSYLAAVVPIREKMQSAESEHFVFRAGPREFFLADFALETLETAYRKIGARLNAFPEGKIPVEIYSTQEAFSLASTLSKETLERSGAIGICKFRRLMILSPEQLAFGYRWQDTLAHELTHYLINIASAGRCPLWLHEGIAKYLDTSWRLDEPQFLTPGNRTELARALREDKLVPFARMEPSMVYLDNQEQVRLAFSQVSHAAHAIAHWKGAEGLRAVLGELARGKSRDQAFESVLGQDTAGFEAEWKRLLAKENLQEMPGASVDALQLGRGDEVSAFVGTNLQGNIRLGDRLRRSDRPDVALIQYDKALQKEPYNPVALTKSARTLLALGREDEALARLETCTSANPNYPSAFLLLAVKMMEKGNWQRALDLVLEANAVNPFNPDVHGRLSVIYAHLGRKDLAARAAAVLNQLDAQPQP